MLKEKAIFQKAVFIKMGKRKNPAAGAAEMEQKNAWRV
jgi:hypothetical protein